MSRSALIAALLLVASPAGAQVAPGSQQQPFGQNNSSALLNGRQPPLGGTGRSAPSQTPTTGVICTEEMTATFCNVVTGPNAGGYGSGGRSGAGASASGGASGASGASGSGAGSTTPSIPPCASEPPANELCD